MQKKLKKFLTLILIQGVLIMGTVNCFGKFALVKKLHEFNESIELGNPWVSKIVRTLIMYVSWMFVGWWMFAIDVIVLNLIEFWTDSNPMAYNEYDENGMYAKTLKKGDETVRLVYFDYGQKLQISLQKGDKNEQFTLFKNKPGKFFKQVDGQYREMQMSSKKIGSKIILKMAIDGKLESSKVVDYKNFHDLNYSYNQGLF